MDLREMVKEKWGFVEGQDDQAPDDGTPAAASWRSIQQKHRQLIQRLAAQAARQN